MTNQLQVLRGTPDTKNIYKKQLVKHQIVNFFHRQYSKLVMMQLKLSSIPGLRNREDSEINIQSPNPFVTALTLLSLNNADVPTIDHAVELCKLKSLHSFNKIAISSHALYLSISSRTIQTTRNAQSYLLLFVWNLLLQILMNCQCWLDITELIWHYQALVYNRWPATIFIQR